uniref:U3 small nucleolar RNA-associated protein 20 C-terminal domain-containing protein n=1 Tax=Grammatophora oceanica TaxID=210454 RepID=A0A7S1UR21_9STRA
MATAAPQSLFTNDTTLWHAVVACLLYPHPWVKRVAIRFLGSCLNELEPTSVGEATSEATSWVRKPGLMFSLTRNTCRLIDAKEADLNEELSICIVKVLSWLAQGMVCTPSMFYNTKPDSEIDDRDPTRWLLTRLCHLGRPKGGRRRSTVFKAFAAIASFCGTKVCENQGLVELMLEPLCRSRTEASAMRSGPNASVQESDESTLANDVQQMLEDKCETVYVEALVAVQKRAREKRARRHEEEAMLDATQTAARKIEKQKREKKRRKRRVEENRRKDGRKQKRRVA